MLALSKGKRLSTTCTESLTLPMPKGRGFLGCSQRTRHAHPKVKRCDRLTRALGTWLSPPLHRRTFPQALRYCRQSTTRRARAPFIPRTEVRGLLTEKITGKIAVLGGEGGEELLAEIDPRAARCSGVTLSKYAIRSIMSAPPLLALRLSPGRRHGSRWCARGDR